MYGKTGELCPNYGKTGERNSKSKKVKVIYPSGEIKDFPCTKDAGRHLGCAPQDVAKWAREGYTPSKGKFAGFRFIYS
jgi:hypothetical protein